MKASAALAALALVSLGATATMSAPVRADEIRISIDPSFSMFDKAVILQTVNEWNVALRGERRIEIVQGGAWTITPSSATAMLNAAKCAAGATNRLTREIAVNDNCMRRGTLAPIMRHELGHMLGLGHIPKTLMDPECCFDMQSIDPVSAELARAIR